MPLRKAQALKGGVEAAPASVGDRISALPDELLHRVLSFLPAQQAVRTCVLARRWIYLWKSATALRIVGADGKGPVPFELVPKFVDCLLLCRGSSPLERFELSVDGSVLDICRVRLWIRYAVQCKVKVLRLNILGGTHALLRPEEPPIASRHLTKLELRGLKFIGDLDFSRCPELQDLLIEGCSFKHAERISSPSLRHLNITGALFSKNFRIHIHAPNLASLLLHVRFGRTPVLESMPLLVSAHISIGEKCNDFCWHSNYGYGVCADESCGGILDRSSCVLLLGMSQAKSLMLTSSPDMFILKRDLKWCPTFSRLKTLGLNENCCVPDVHVLASILEHSPVLENLFLSLFNKLYQDQLDVKIEGRFNPNELPPTISSHLKGVVVTCGKFDERVLKVLTFLSKLNISFSFNK